MGFAGSQSPCEFTEQFGCSTFKPNAGPPVSLRRPAVDDDNRRILTNGALQKSNAGVHFEGGACDEQSVRAVDEVECFCKTLAGNQFAKEDDVRFQHARAIGARGHDKVAEISHVDISVRPLLPVVRRSQHRIGPRQLPRDGLARKMLTAIQTHDRIHSPVQLNDAQGARTTVQTVDILSHDSRHDSRRLKLRECAMTCVGFRGGESAPSHVTTRPVSAASALAFEKLPDGHGRAVHGPFAAVIGDSGVRAYSRSRENGDCSAAENSNGIVSGVHTGVNTASEHLFPALMFASYHVLMAVSRRTYIRRRITVFGTAGLVFASALYLPMTLLAPLGEITPSVQTVASPANPAVELAWPGVGSAAIGAVGFPGVLAQSPNPSAWPIASVTKIVTSLVVLEKKPLGPKEAGPAITMTQADVDEYHRQIANNGSTEPVAAGVTMTQRQLLEVVLVASANNYAETMARWAFGSESALLSAARTWLEAHALHSIVLFDATGLDPRNTATAADLVELGKIALANPVIASIVATKSVDVPYVGTIVNTNKLLGWNGIDGIKTGTVEQDNVCLLFSSTITVGSTAIDLVGVVLGSRSHDKLDAAVQALLASAMQGFREIPLVQAGDVFATYVSDWGDDTKAVASKSATATVWGGVPVTVSIHVDPIMTGHEGQRVGTIVYTVDGETSTVPLVLDDQLDDPGPWWRLSHPFG